MTQKRRDPQATRENLERIARSLDQPVSAFFDETGSTTREAETLALVKAFERILDHQARTRCLAFIIAEAKHN